MRLKGALIAFLVSVLITLACTVTPALATPGEGCSNEQLRQESNINPATSESYSVGLPECRAYEMVSPPEKSDSDIKASHGLPVAPNGEAIGFVSQNAFGDSENYQVGALGEAANPYIARRASTGWTTSSALAPRWLIEHPSPSGIGGDASVDLSQIATCGLRYDRTNEGTGDDAVCALREPNGAWQTTPIFPSTTGGIYAGGTDGHTIEYEGSSSDLADVLFQSDSGPLSSAAFLPADTSLAEGDGLYEVEGLGSTSPQLSLVNVNEGGEEIGPAMATGVGGITGGDHSDGGGPSPCAGVGSSESSSSYHAISASGQTIYFTACPGDAEGGVNEIYARVDGGRTVDISNPAEESASECTMCDAAPSSAAYEGASADGSKAFFLTAQQLVNGDTDTTMDLYEYDFANPSGKNIVQLSAGGSGDATPGNGAEVEGVVRTSSDGSRVYFVAKGVLTTVPNGVGQVALQGADNLYAVDTLTDETKFVGDLCSDAGESGAAADSQCPADLNASPDAEFGGRNDLELWSADEGRRAQATPSGQYLVFTTYAHLISDGPEAELREVGGQGVDGQQVYRYDFTTGILNRISIGEPAFAASNNGNVPEMNAVIAPLPSGGITPKGALASIDDYNRAISEDGSTIVFATPERLQVTDVNTGAKPSCETAPSEGGGSQATGCDVYIWHECANGRCEDGTTGEVSMISPGDDPTSADTEYGQASMSASGADVFFLTRTPLVGGDRDHLVDVYDARIDGGFSAPTPEGSCSGESCQGAATTPSAFGSPGTASFTGGANLVAPKNVVTRPPTKPLSRAQKLAKALKQCRKDKARWKRVSCEKSARKRYAPPKRAHRRR